MRMFIFGLAFILYLLRLTRSKEYKKKFIVIAQNNAKERTHNAPLKVNELCQYSKAKVSEEHYLIIQSVTEKSRENEFIKKKENLIYKFNELQKTSSIRNNQ